LEYRADAGTAVFPAFIPTASPSVSYFLLRMPEYISFVAAINVSSTPIAVLADVSKKTRSFLRANAAPSSVGTYRWDAKSDLLPTRMISILL
jgi:hypothetical protein